MHDIVFRGGTVVDGTGAPARQADVATFVAGEAVREHDVDTGARPGRLVRGARSGSR